jgi:hypothetical protein
MKMIYIYMGLHAIYTIAINIYTHNIGKDIM